MKKLKERAVLIADKTPPKELTRADYVQLIDAYETAIDMLIQEARSKGIILASRREV